MSSINSIMSWWLNTNPKKNTLVKLDQFTFFCFKNQQTLKPRPRSSSLPTTLIDLLGFQKNKQIYIYTPYLSVGASHICLLTAKRNASIHTRPQLTKLETTLNNMDNLNWKKTKHHSIFGYIIKTNSEVPSWRVYTKKTATLATSQEFTMAPLRRTARLK